MKWLTVVMLVGWATAAAAQAEETCDRDGYDGMFFDYPRLQREHWPEEAKRFGEDVSRNGRRLHLRLEDGRTTDLVDCPHDSTAYAYLYQRYDEAGRFYIVERPAYEDFSYTLVMRKTGRQYSVPGLPIWATDRAHFLTVGCAIARDQRSLAIQAPSGDGLAVEAEIPLPCEAESCSARWDSPSWISVFCTPFDDPATRKKGTEFVVIKGNDGAWKKFGR